MAFQDRVEATLDANLASDAAVVTVTMADGARHTLRIDHGIGSATRPMTDAQLETKFRAMAEPILGAQRTDGLIDSCWAVESLADAGQLARDAA